ncbi:hypothetical protein VNI00_000308 [Paramarasmius palmivorus]|uniref:CN hydrolase domain-containing protein n=1 Tax=Paramarasmius palmivorus TaxID=297713 RepID=A0AAW0EEW2_9AGAR
MEGPMFVISSTQILRPENAALCGLEGVPLNPAKGGGFAAIYGPDGRQLTPPVNPGEETILYADLDLDQIRTAKLLVDPVGHYSRPDLLSLHVATPPTKPAKLVKYSGDVDSGLLSKIPQLPTL